MKEKINKDETVFINNMTMLGLIQSNMVAEK
jgi:hypothetical protein